MTEEMFSRLVNGYLDLILQEVEGKTERRSRAFDCDDGHWVGAKGNWVEYFKESEERERYREDLIVAMSNGQVQGQLD